jgi:hypothetical protein
VSIEEYHDGAPHFHRFFCFKHIFVPDPVIVADISPTPNFLIKVWLPVLIATTT